MTRVAITGSSGYLGTSLAGQLAEKPEVERIIGLDVREPARPVDKLTFVRHDMTAEGLGEIFARERVDKVVHLAYVVNPLHNRKRMREINVGGSKNLLMACANERVKTVVVASSGTAYGAHPDNPEYLTEDMPLRANPKFQYAAEKQVVEGMVRSFAESYPDKQVKVIRPCIIYGPNVSNYLSRMVERDHAVVVKGSKSFIQLVHEEDCARAVAGLLWKGSPGAYNIASDGRISFPQMAEHTGKEVKEVSAWLLRFVLSLEWLFRSKFNTPPSIVPYLRYSWTMDNSKLKKEIGFSYKYSTEETLKIFLAAMQKPQS